MVAFSIQNTKKMVRLLFYIISLFIYTSCTIIARKSVKNETIISDDISVIIKTDRDTVQIGDSIAIEAILRIFPTSQ